VAAIPWYDTEKTDQMLGFCEALLKTVPMYQLKFRADDSVAGFLESVILKSK